MADSEAQSNGDTPKVTGHFKPFLHRTTPRYRMTTSSVSALGERAIGSNSNLAALSGSTQNLLDPVKMMSLQEDARSRKISSEVMKRCLYKSVTAPCRRRIVNRMSTSSSHYNDRGTPRSANFYSRQMMSLPVTPMQSLRVTPSQSPTEDRQFFYGFLSHGPTPRSTTPVQMEDDDELENAAVKAAEEDEDKGLASLFRPKPRYIAARAWSSSAQRDCDDELNELAVGEPRSESSIRLRSPNSFIKRKAMNLKAATPV